MVNQFLQCSDRTHIATESLPEHKSEDYEGNQNHYGERYRRPQLFGVPQDNGLKLIRQHRCKNQKSEKRRNDQEYVSNPLVELAPA